MLTKYLVLAENEMSPMPWRMPYCGFLLKSKGSKTDSVFKVLFLRVDLKIFEIICMKLLFKIGLFYINEKEIYIII